MAPPKHHLCLVLTIFLSVLALSPSPTMAVSGNIPRLPKLQKPNVKIPLPSSSSKLVVQLCTRESITNRRFCLKALVANPQAVAAKNMNQLAGIVMDLAKANAQATLNVIIKMMKQPGLPPKHMHALESCMNNYKYVSHSFGMISMELSGDPLTANYDASVIAPEADACEKALTDAKLHAPRISIGNRFLHFYSSMGAAVTSYL